MSKKKSFPNSPNDNRFLEKQRSKIHDIMNPKLSNPFPGCTRRTVYNDDVSEFIENKPIQPELQSSNRFHNLKKRQLSLNFPEDYYFDNSTKENFRYSIATLTEVNFMGKSSLNKIKF